MKKENENGVKNLIKIISIFRVQQSIQAGEMSQSRGGVTTPAQQHPLDVRPSDKSRECHPTFDVEPL